MDRIAQIMPFPEVLKGIEDLVNNQHDATLTIFKDYRMYWANGCEVVINDEGDYLDPEITEGAGTVADWKTEIIDLPFIRLHFYPKPTQHKFDLQLWLEIPMKSGDNESSSLYAKFQQSDYAKLFYDCYDTEDGIKNVSMWIPDSDIVLASKLISYYILYYGFNSVAGLEISLD